MLPEVCLSSAQLIVMFIVQLKIVNSSCAGHHPARSGEEQVERNSRWCSSETATRAMRAGEENKGTVCTWSA